MSLPQILAALSGQPSRDTISDQYLQQLDLSTMSYDALCTLVDEGAPTLEKAADALREVACRLRELRNAGSCTSRLPPELLARIFSYFVGQCFKDKDLVAVTRVCRRWRGD